MKNFTVKIDTGMVASIEHLVCCKTEEDAKFIARRLFSFSGPERFILVGKVEAQ